MRPPPATGQRESERASRPAACNHLDSQAFAFSGRCEPREPVPPRAPRTGSQPAANAEPIISRRRHDGSTQQTAAPGGILGAVVFPRHGPEAPRAALGFRSLLKLTLRVGLGCRRSRGQSRTPLMSAVDETSRGPSRPRDGRSSPPRDRCASPSPA